MNKHLICFPVFACAIPLAIGHFAAASGLPFVVAFPVAAVLGFFSGAVGAHLAES